MRESGRPTTELVTTPAGTTLWSEAAGGGPTQLDPPPAGDERRPSGIPPFAAGSLAEIRAVLPESQIKGPFVDEPTGRDVYEIEATADDADLLGRWRMSYRVDATTFAPVRLVRTLLEAPPENVSPRPGDTVTMDFTKVERLSSEDAAPALRPAHRER